MSQQKNQEQTMKVFNMLNADERVRNHEKFTLPSLTVPDQTMSMREMLNRHMRGEILDNGKKSIFQDEPETSFGVNARTLDLTDIQRMSIQNQERINELNQELSVQKEQAKKLREEQKQLKKQQEEDRIKEIAKGLAAQ